MFPLIGLPCNVKLFIKAYDDDMLVDWVSCSQKVEDAIALQSMVLVGITFVCHLFSDI